MSLVKVENLTFSYPGSYENIFESINFSIDSDWKLGLIGRNGRGKTTLLNLLLGNYEYSGKIVSSVKFEYFPYKINEKSRLTVDILSEICCEAEEWQFMKEFYSLQVDTDVLYRPFETLSNGEQTKVLLAALFLNEGRFLLIDEPTNHLDMNARKIVSDYLKKKKGFILVSHDRNFIDGCVDHILSMNKADIQIVKGNFSSWWENKEKRDALEIASNSRLKQEVRRLSESVRRSAIWSNRVEKSKTGAFDKGYIGHKSAKMMKRSKVVEARRYKIMEEKSKLLKNIETAESLKICALKYFSDTLVELRNVSIRYGDKSVFDLVSFCVKQGDRIVIDGKNGGRKK